MQTCFKRNTSFVRQKFDFEYYLGEDAFIYVPIVKKEA